MSRNEIKQKISNALRTHGSILAARTSRGLKDIITIEQEYRFYYVRKYLNGESYSTYLCFTLTGAIKRYNEDIKLIEEFDNVNLNYNVLELETI